MQVGDRCLRPSLPFSGMMDGRTTPLGQIELLVTFEEQDNFRTEIITFDVTKFDLPYNAILGRPALTKFMTAVHYAYNTLKIRGPTGVISVTTDIKGVVHCIKKLYDIMVRLRKQNALNPPNDL